MVRALGGRIFGDHIDGLKAIVSDMHLSAFTHKDSGFGGLGIGMKGLRLKASSASQSRTDISTSGPRTTHMGHSGTDKIDE
jgi:hypothetical protein